MIYQGVPEGFVEFHGDLGQFGQAEEDSAEDDGSGFHLLAPIQQGLVTGLGGFVPLGQFCVLCLVFLLRQGCGGVHHHAVADHAGEQFQFGFLFFNVCIDEVRAGQGAVDRTKTLDPLLRIGHVFTDCLEESLLQDFFVHMGCGAFGFVLEFPVALPDHPAIFAIGVPDLGTIHTATVTADDLSGKGSEAVVPSSQLLPPGNLHLNRFPFGRLNDGRVAALYIVLGDFTFVDLHGFCEKIHGVGLLQECRALVFFIGENAIDGLGLPLGFAARGGDAFGFQQLADVADGFSSHEQSVDSPDNLGLLRINLRQTIRSLAITQELFIGHADLAVSEPLPLSPGNIFRNGSAFLLALTF